MTRLRVPKEGGRFPARFHNGVDPSLVGPKAIHHPAVAEWHRWLLRDYKPEYTVMLVTPCSNVKPYTRSPTSRKVRGLLRRLGLWDGARDRPRLVEWVYLSDLLALVPYYRAEEYPACCYELHPDDALRVSAVFTTVTRVISETIARLTETGWLYDVVLFLPRKHLVLWDYAMNMALSGGRKWPREKRVPYTIFSTRELEYALRTLLHIP